MRILAGVIIGITAVTLLHILGWPSLAWMLTRIPPTTPTDFRPRFRAWHKGVEVIHENRAS